MRAASAQSIYPFFPDEFDISTNENGEDLTKFGKVVHLFLGRRWNANTKKKKLTVNNGLKHGVALVLCRDGQICYYALFVTLFIKFVV